MEKMKLSNPEMDCEKACENATVTLDSNEKGYIQYGENKKRKFNLKPTENEKVFEVEFEDDEEEDGENQETNTKTEDITEEIPQGTDQPEVVEGESDETQNQKSLDNLKELLEARLVTFKEELMLSLKEASESTEVVEDTTPEEPEAPKEEAPIEEVTPDAVEETTEEVTETPEEDKNTKSFVYKTQKKFEIK